MPENGEGVSETLESETYTACTQNTGSDWLIDAFPR